MIVPVEIPVVSKDQLKAWSKLSFPELAEQIFSLYVDREEISSEDLHTILQNCFKLFTDPHVVVPIKHLNELRTDGKQMTHDLFIAELFHGPTLAFKDIGLQFIGELFSFLIEKKRYKPNLSIVVATSGDTGKLTTM